MESNFSSIISNNKDWAFLNQECFLMANKLESGVNIDDHIKLITAELCEDYTYEDVCKKDISPLNDVRELMFKKFWIKLPRIHKLNRIHAYIRELPGISEENMTEVYDKVVKGLDDKKYSGTNSIAKESKTKKSKHVIDYDPYNGKISDISNIDKGKKKYTVDF